MSEQMDPRQEGAPSFSADNTELLRRAQAEAAVEQQPQAPDQPQLADQDPAQEQTTSVPEVQPETGAPSPERQQPGRENLTVTYLNTSFSSVFDNDEGLDKLLLREGEPRENAVLGLSEVVQDKRDEVREKLEARGYRVVEPPKDSELDLIWAIGPGPEVESSDIHPFPRKGIRRFASRRSSKGKRHVGIQEVTLTTAQGNKIRLGQQRLSPWVTEPVRRKQVQDMGQTLREKFQPTDDPDDDALLTVDGGDMNHTEPLRKPDDELWARLEEEQGWKPVLEPGTPTHTTGDKYPTVSRLFKAVGRDTDGQQLDAVYARPRAGVEMTNQQSDTDIELQPNQIGFTTQTIEVEGTDHFGVETTFSLPVRASTT